MSTHRLCVSAALVSVLACAASANSVVNGDFSNDFIASPLAGDWAVTFGTVAWHAGGFAVLEEDPGLLLSSIEQTIVIPAGAERLSFDYGLSSTPDGTSGFPIPDAFAAYLLDPVTLDPILSTPPFYDYFYEGRDGFQDYDPSIVTVVGSTVTLDLTSVPGGTDALIIFDLMGGNDGYYTEATVDNVTLQVIPEPVTMVSGFLALTALGAYLRRRPA